jgi:hypothetical protein
VRAFPPLRPSTLTQPNLCFHTPSAAALHGTDEERMVKAVGEIVAQLVAANDAGRDLDIVRYVCVWAAAVLL